MKKVMLAFLLMFGLLVGFSGVAAAAPNEHANEKAHHQKDADHGANRDGDFTAQDPPVEDTSNDHGNRPSDGSVGNADDKNPPGQSHKPEDLNNGYECDGNNGVGKGNPAHSACAPTVTEPPVKPEPPKTPEEPKTRHHHPKPRLIPPVVIERAAPAPVPASVTHTPAVAKPVAPGTPQLAVTGNNSGLLVSGLILVFFGGLLLWATKVRKA